MIRTSLAALAAFGTFAGAAAPAAAQSWGVSIGVGSPRPAAYYGYRGDGRMRDYICSGARAHQLEGRLRHEVRDGDIDGYQARRIHQIIDRTEDDQSYACSRGGWGDVRDIAGRYDRIEGWIANAASRGNGYYCDGHDRRGYDRDDY